MKSKLLTVALIILACFSSTAQDAEDILRRSYAKCRSVQNGYYLMSDHMKFGSEKDTTENTFECWFLNVPDDPLNYCHFHLKENYQDGKQGGRLYNGRELVDYYGFDSSGHIRSVTLWADEIRSIAGRSNLFKPFTTKESYPLLHDSDLNDATHLFKYIGEENVNNESCYHIQVNKMQENDINNSYRVLRMEDHFWIKKSDYLPVQYSMAVDILMNNDTMYQFEMLSLKKYELDKMQDEPALQIQAIPSFYKLKDYTPFVPLPPLATDTLAPGWTLTSIDGEVMSLKDLKGKLVLLDFFYKSCYPCMLALPALEAFNKKYRKKGLRIIGIDPYDKNAEDLKVFLSKRGVSYSILLSGPEIPKDYRVHAYPTMFMISKTGKVILVQVGYGDEVDEMLEDLINRNL